MVRLQSIFNMHLEKLFYHFAPTIIRAFKKEQQKNKKETVGVVGLGIEWDLAPCDWACDITHGKEQMQGEFGFREGRSPQVDNPYQFIRTVNAT